MNSALIPTTLSLLAFAGNSLLCRAALGDGLIDAASFTALRLVSGAVMLWLILRPWRRPAGRRARGSWASALALFVYAAGFSFAYIQLTAATGALLLFGAVQVSMIGVGLMLGERFRGWRLLGLVLALGGLIALLLPGLSAPPAGAAILMMLAGLAWGVYSLRGRGSDDPMADTAGNFLRSVPLALLLLTGWYLLHGTWHLSSNGVLLALISGAVTSGLGYVIWYRALPMLSSGGAATVQLSVPVITALGGVIILSELPSLRLLICGAAVLVGIALVLRRPG